MSGFVALFDRSRTGVSRDSLHAMGERIDHRGPDGEGYWCTDDAGLGHKLLRSTPESRYDDQPYHEDGVVVAGDARLDNRAALFASLDVREDPGRVPDSRLLFEAYQEWGRQCTKHLIGSFAFVVWDGPKHEMFCARDRFGVKPLYYHLSDDMFAAASEKKALLTLPSVSGTVNETKVGDYLTKTFDDTEATFFESIRRLPPAHVSSVDVSTDRISRYWKLDPNRTIELPSDAAYERRFRELFEEAVRCRLRVAGSVGSTLSGGMDSSSITTVARALLPEDEPLHTFSNVFDDAPSSDERGFIETVTPREGIESHYVYCDDIGALEDLELVFQHFDQPPHNTLHFGRWERAKRANEVGIDAMLGGALGDTAIGYGLGLLPQLLLTGRWLTLREEIDAMCEVLDSSPREMFRRHVLRHVVPEPIRRLRQRIKGNPILLDKQNPTLRSEFVERQNLRRRYRRLNSEWLGIVWSDRHDQRDALVSGRVPATFETSDVINSAFGIEPRYPFTDKRLVEFCLAIPPSQKFSQGWTRSIVRRSLGEYLPEEIQWRPWKTTMNDAFYNALRNEAELFDEFFERPGVVSEFVDMDALARCYRELGESPEHRKTRALWSGLSLWAWLSHYDGINREDTVHGGESRESSRRM